MPDLNDGDVVHADDMLGLCAFVGFITINWSVVEHQLDNCIAMVISDFGGLPKYKKIPRQYSTKSAYLREAFNSKTQFTHFKEPMIALLDRADIAADKRNTMIHGTIDKVEGGTLSMSKLDYDAGLLQKAQMRFDTEPDSGLVPEFARLSTDWLNFSNNLFHATRVAEAKMKKYGTLRVLVRQVCNYFTNRLKNAFDFNTALYFLAAESLIV